MNLSYMLAAISVDAWKITSPILMILMTLVGIALIVIVMMQKSGEANIGAISGSETDTYMGKNKGRSRDAILKKVTIILGAVLLVVSILFFVLQHFVA